MTRFIDHVSSLCLSFAFSLGLLVVSSLPAASQVSPYEQALLRVLNDPSNPESSFQFARIAAEAGDTRGAIAALERILIQYPNLANIKLELGVLYLSVGATEIAEDYISQALESPDAPPEVRERAEEFQRSARKQNSPSSLGGYVEFGVTSDSNANAGPASTVIGGGLIPSDQTGQSDVSGFLRGRVNYRYDLGLQAGHKLAADLIYAGKLYSDQTQLNFGFIGISAGVDFNLTRALKRPSRLELRFDAGKYNRNGMSFLDLQGGSAKLLHVLNAKSILTLEYLYSSQDYIDNSDFPRNSIRDGSLQSLSVRYKRDLGKKSSIELGFYVNDKTAQEDFEAYDEVFALASYEKRFASPVESLKDDWKMTLDGRFGNRSYDGPDPIFGQIFADGASQDDDLLFLAARLEVPVRGFATFAELGYTDNDSNYEIDEYDNRFLTFGIRKAF
jgi:tetratricopeptide (TPR) repeat protein